MTESQKHSSAALDADDRKQAYMQASMSAIASGDIDAAHVMRAEVEKQESLVNYHLAKAKEAREKGQ